MSIFLLNYRSIRKNRNNPFALLSYLTCSFDIIALSESWLVAADTDPVLEGYKLFRVDKSESDGEIVGGLLMFVHSRLNACIVSLPKHQTFELLSIAVYLMATRNIYAPCYIDIDFWL